MGRKDNTREDDPLHCSLFSVRIKRTSAFLFFSHTPLWRMCWSVPSCVWIVQSQYVSFPVITSTKKESFVIFLVLFILSLLVCDV